MTFIKAQKKQARVKVALCGPSGSGKTYSALLLARGMGKKIALIDTERGSASLYADVCDFDTLEISPPYSFEKYIAAIKEAEDGGYEVLVIDSISHAWAGAGGALEKADDGAKSAGGNKFVGWRNVTPQQNRFIDALTGSKCHIIATMRSKTEWIIESGKPVKVGLAPVQRDGMEYEFSLVFDISRDGNLAKASKDRTGLYGEYLGRLACEDGSKILAWATNGAIDVPRANQEALSDKVKAVIEVFGPTKDEVWEFAKGLKLTPKAYMSICEENGIAISDTSTHTPGNWGKVWSALANKENDDDRG